MQKSKKEISPKEREEMILKAMELKAQINKSFENLNIAIILAQAITQLMEHHHLPTIFVEKNLEKACDLLDQVSDLLYVSKEEKTKNE